MAVSKQMTENAGDPTQPLADVRWENFARLMARPHPPTEPKGVNDFKRQIGISTVAEPPKETKQRIAYLRAYPDIYNELELSNHDIRLLVKRTRLKILKAKEATEQRLLEAARDLEHAVDVDEKQGRGRRNIVHELTAAVLNQIGAEKAGYVAAVPGPVLVEPEKETEAI